MGSGALARIASIWWHVKHNMSYLGAVEVKWVRICAVQKRTLLRLHYHLVYCEF